ncbi:cobalamin B12-binding domain-containing protein [Bradyrhizobium amphicarpaeae]|uniref:Cobalamin-binding protein n=1 Tax=Bradyrhizobium amphicarpaeae TaxID=1404768 RepID=A0A2U8PY49_9BRAD|nr:cobalamin B12-binding domain-containing protein [Bradyrhizobium amphicarpaeae]AWM02760.1 cobalamin-binding protein [Bradyrhizobium amphicarpaeae]
MTDVNERSFSTGSATDTASASRPKSLRQRIPAPIWRFRPTLQPVAVVRTIKTQIIPKIVLALRSAPIAKPPETAEPTAPTEVEMFAALALGADDGAAFAYVVDLQAKGASVESIFIDLLAPAARQLGAQWESDTTDFASVTVGVGRLQLIMHRLGDSFAQEAGDNHGGESALLTIIPGDQHSFGLSMVAEFFRRAGWNLCTGPFSSHQELTSLVHNHWFDIVGFSVSSDRRLDELKKDIHDIRRDSRNRHVGIILGGPMITAQPGLVASMGADMMSADAITAPHQAHGLIEQMKGRK